MTTDTFVTQRPDIDRDRWGRPLVVPPGGGKAVAYTRCTTYVGAIEDTYNLSRWQQRMVATGLVDRPDLLLAASAHRDDKSKLDQVCADAMEAAKAHAAATTGTALHGLTERMDRGEDVGVVPAAYLADLAAYATATQGFKHRMIEQFCVQDPLKIGGTPDRVVEYQGKRYIADLKTGSIDYGYLKIAAQLAVYARSRPYDIATGQRLDPHDASTERGIIIHLPAGTGTCTLLWVDLIAGWDVVRTCRSIREQRARPKRDLVSKFDTPPATPKTADTALVPVVAVDTTSSPTPLAARITACATPEAVRALWSEFPADAWTPDLIDAAKARIASL